MALSLGRTVSTLTLAAGLAVGTAGTATAQTLTVDDQRGDVHWMTETSTAPAPEPGVRNGDVVRTVLRHEGRRVAVRVRFVDLSKQNSDGRVDYVRVVTNEGVRRDVSVFAGPGMWRGRDDMSTPRGRTVRCNVAHHIDYAANVVTVSFPRSCVSNPRWVRLGVGAAWFASQKTYADDAQNSGHISESSVRLSPRLRRG